MLYILIFLRYCVTWWSLLWDFVVVLSSKGCSLLCQHSFLRLLKRDLSKEGLILKGKLIAEVVAK